MLQLLGVIFVMVCFYKAREWWQEQNGEWGSKKENPLLIYVLGSLLTSLKPDERILIRDNIDGVFKAYQRQHKGKDIDLTRIDTIHKFYNLETISNDAGHALNKMFSVLQVSINNAPSGYKEELSIKELHKFLKEKI